MVELGQLREVEKLVEDSVFNPSPRHQLRQRVLQRALEAKHRQKLWRRFAVASSAVFGTLLLFALIFVRVHSKAPATAVEPGPVRVQVYLPAQHVQLSSSPQTAAEPQSLGEEMYFRSVRSRDHKSAHAPGANGF